MSNSNSNISSLLQVKNSFRLRFQNLMTNVLKIALSKDEEMLACIITAYYEVVLEEEMIVRALANENYQWLLYVFAFEKNYVGPRNKEDSHFIAFEYLFDMIKKHYWAEPEVCQAKIREILEWKVIS